MLNDKDRNKKDRPAAVFDTASIFLFHEPAGHPVTGSGFLEDRFFLRALRHSDWTACVEAATLGRVERAWHIALQDSAITLYIRMRNRNGREQCLSLIHISSMLES